ncbi:hypothetical protein FIV42_21330 [Persicimonas caeni]|uniref:Glycosyltransferase RgtA/B/C/D-like domain-containing protein n=1 Tax=Persicimonas caeni TaxID=2292766 RepID=A0A4Y6PXZ4_PERCE|nr:hypothetical protein [Persicimonas caeni]QDG53194.1 hypothetical protein FIV42_21330 [Persicimonas caeni]QED34416.1 hypothetical protein FRD00_21325 [Persicimonas caeni]
MAHHSSDSTSTSKPPRRYLQWPLPLAAIWLLAPVVGILIRLSLEPVGPHDYWWHLAMGKLIAATGGIPTENLFLYTLEADAAFFDQPWLGQWAMYALYEAFGHAGPIVLRNALAATAWAGIVGAALMRCRDPRVVGGLALLTAVVSGPVFGVRTQMFAFVPYVLLVGVLFAVATERLRRPWLLVLVPLTALWANLHGTFMLVPVLAGLTGGSLVVEHWIEERTFDPVQIGWWGGTVLAVSLAAMLNPLGPHIFVYVWELTFVSQVSETVTEWQPPSIDTPMGVVVLLTLTASLVVLALRRKKVRLFEAVLFAATAYLAVSAVRQMFWWGAVMLMVVPRHLSALLSLDPWWEDRTSQAQGVAHAVAAAVLVAAAVASQPGLWLHDVGSELRAGVARRTPPAQGLLKVDSPTRLVSQLAERGYPGTIFHDQASGGYLGFALGIGPTDARTNQVAFVDQRMELIPEAVWDEYFQLSRAQQGWREVVERYGIRTMLLSPREQWRLVQVLQGDPAWTLVGVDEAHLLFMRSDQTDHLTQWR